MITHIKQKWCADFPAEYSIRYWIFLISPLIYIPLIVMVTMYWLMIVKINRFIGKLQRSTGLSSKDASSYNSNSNNSSLGDVYELRSMQEAHKKRMQVARKKQLRSKTEPTDSPSRQSQASYFSEIDDLQLYGRHSRASTISATFTSTSLTPRGVPKSPYTNGIITTKSITTRGPTYFHQQDHLHPHHLHFHHLYPQLNHPHPLQTTINVEQSSKNLQADFLPLPIPLPLIRRNNIDKLEYKNTVKNEIVLSKSSVIGNGTTRSKDAHAHNQHEQRQDEHCQNNKLTGDQTDGVKKLQQLAASRQVMSANLYKRSVMFTIIVFCLITFIFWLPLQGKLCLPCLAYIFLIIIILFVFAEAL